MLLHNFERRNQRGRMKAHNCFMDNGNVAEVICLQVPYTFKIWQITRKSNGLCFPDYMLSLKFWLKSDEKCGNSSLFKILTSGILQNAPNDPKLNSKNQAWQAPICVMRHIGPQASKFHPFRSTISRFQDIAHFRISPWTPPPHVKISKYHKYLFFARPPKYL